MEMKSLFIIIFIFLLSQVDAYHHGFLNSRIVGGRSAQPGQFPYIVSLKYKDSHVCGGSIISPNYILTAAHCFMHRVDGEGIDSVFSIRAGSIYLEEGGVVVSIEETMQHPGFNNLSFDIGLVRLKQPLNFTQHINSINLAKSDPPMSANIVTAGWGSLGDDSTRSEILQYTTLSSLTNRECNQLYSNISESSLCLLPDPFILNSICRGDSGGPAVYNNELVGIASYVINGCGTKDPNVFVSVAYTADWIRENSDLN